MKNLSKISCGKQVYYLLSEETEDEDINLTMCDGQDAWAGTVLETDLRKQSRVVKMGFSDFMDETNKALSRKNLGGLNFVYEVKEFDDCLKLTWKKHLKSDSIKIQLGTATLNKKSDPSEVIRQMFEYSLDVNESLIKNISNLEGTNQRLASERETALKKFEKCVAAKEDLESNIYSKFVVILNTKKAKLRELQADLEDQAKHPPASHSGAGDSNNKSDSDNDVPVKQKEYEEDEETTDEEKEPVAKRKRGKVSSFQSDDSLLLSGEDVSEPSTSTARRRRRAPTTQKKTPSKPLLPKVTSDKTTPGRPTLKKTPSRQSNSSTKSSDPDVEDLIDEF